MQGFDQSLVGPTVKQKNTKKKMPSKSDVHLKGPGVDVRLRDDPSTSSTCKNLWLFCPSSRDVHHIQISRSGLITSPRGEVSPYRSRGTDRIHRIGWCRPENNAPTSG